MPTTLKFSMPLFKPRGTASEYEAFYEHSRVVITRGVRSIPGDTANYNGLDIEVYGLSDDSLDRITYAMTDGRVLFSRPETSTGERYLRAIVELDHPRPTNVLSSNSSRLKRHHPAHSLGVINENFYTLTYIEYQHLALDATRHMLIEFINQVWSNRSRIEYQRVLEQTLVNETPLGSRSRRARRRPTLASWLTAGNSIDHYVNNILLGEETLNAVTGSGATESRRRGGGFPLWVNAGDPIGCIDLVRGTEGDPESSFRKVFLKFKGAAEIVLNPVFFLNAIVKHRAELHFVGEEHIADNKLGVQTLLDVSNTQSLAAPPAGSRTIHPLVWALSKDNFGVFRLADDGRIMLDDFQQLYVPSAEPLAVDPRLEHNLLDVETRGMNVFHPHIRYTVRNGQRTGERLSAGLYQWKINNRGYLVFRSNSDSLQEDDWYPSFGQSELNIIQRIWQQNGENISRLSLMYGLPCETFVAVAGKESGGNSAAVGLEHWIPPPSAAANLPPFTDRTSLVAVPPEELLSRYAHVRGIKYMILTNIWTGERWHPQRKGISFPGVARIDDSIPGISITYTWRELLQDLDYYGHTPSGGPQPRESRQDKRFLRTMDGRISPGLTQVLVREVPFQSGVRPTVISSINSLDSNFFFQSDNPLYPGESRNVLLRDTPPSFRFLWLRDGAHTLFSSFNLIDSRANQLIPYRRTGTSTGYQLGENNDPLDPLFAVTFYGGMGDIDSFVREDSAFGFLGGAVSQNNRRLHTFPPKYNACVYFFETSGHFGESRLIPPSVRFLKKRAD